MRVNLDGLDAFGLKLKDLQSFEKDAFLENTCNRIAGRVLSDVVTVTYDNKVTGTLSKGFRAIPAVKEGDKYKSTIYNPVYYASYVEFGHRTRNHTGWVNGRFYLTNSTNKVADNVDGFVKKDFERFLIKKLGG